MTTRWRRSGIRYGFILVSVVIVVAANAALSHVGQKTLNTLLPLMDTSVSITLQLTRFHLWFEEYIGGDPDVTPEAVWEHFYDAQNSVTAMRFDSQPSGFFVRFGPQPSLASSFDELDSLLYQLKAIGKSREQNRHDPGRANALDEDFEAVIRQAFVVASTIKSNLQALSQSNIQFLRTLSLVMNFMFVALGGGALAFMRRQDIQRSATERQQIGARHRTKPGLDHHHRHRRRHRIRESKIPQRHWL